MAAADDLGYEYEEAVFQWNQAYSGIKEVRHSAPLLTRTSRPSQDGKKF